jgi:hypothetical protein
MSTHPILGFCPYLPVNEIFTFGGWELGPLHMFDGRWTDPAFEKRAKAFIAKFTDSKGKPIENPSLLGRRGQQVDGAAPTFQEVEALQHAIAFGFLDSIPRLGTENEGNDSWSLITSDNAEVFFWPIDVESGYVTVTSGIMIRNIGGGYKIDDKELIIRAPLDLHMPAFKQTADPVVLEAVYQTTLESLLTPKEDVIADRIRVAVAWFTKAWRNTATVRWEERVVFLKTAFEALTATDRSHLSAAQIRQWFEELPDTSPSDAKKLIWSPAETERFTRIWTSGGKQKTEQLTDLEHWFMSFGDARNCILHEGSVPVLTYKEAGSNYNGAYVFTGEFLFRVIVKVLLTRVGYDDLWRGETWRIIKAACAKFSIGSDAEGSNRELKAQR